MRALLDTHTLLWAAHEPTRLPTGVRDALTDPATVTRVCAAAQGGDPACPGDFRGGPVTCRMPDHLRFAEMPITCEHASRCHGTTAIRSTGFSSRRRRPSIWCSGPAIC